MFGCPKKQLVLLYERKVYILEEFTLPVAKPFSHLTGFNLLKMILLQQLFLWLLKDLAEEVE